MGNVGHRVGVLVMLYATRRTEELIRYGEKASYSVEARKKRNQRDCIQQDMAMSRVQCSFRNNVSR
jgi:hypothetical protein